MIPLQERDPTTQHLYELRHVIANHYLCNQILTMKNNSNDYIVPCFHSCSPREYSQMDQVCDHHMAGLGHAVLNKNGSLIGVAAWACQNNAAHGQPTPLPVGMALVNSTVWNSPYLCATIIEHDSLGYGPGKEGRFRDYCLDKI
jgi:hypothetical protein